MSTRTRLGNRRRRRCEDKAILCLSRLTKIPLGVRAKIDAVWLEHFALRRGLAITAIGQPYRLSPEDIVRRQLARLAVPPADAAPEALAA